jgi:hypothetical protein
MRLAATGPLMVAALLGAPEVRRPAPIRFLLPHPSRC